MALYWKAVAGILLTAVLGVTLSRQEKDLALVLSGVACCMAAGIALHYLAPILNLLAEIEKMGGLEEEGTALLIRILGIGLVSQIGSMICNDSGSNTLGKTLQFLSSAVILNLAMPLFSGLLELIQSILGGI